jgi:hypothetical protein
MKKDLDIADANLNDLEEKSPSTKAMIRRWAIIKMIPKYPATLPFYIIDQRLRDAGFSTTPKRLRHDMQIIQRAGNLQYTKDGNSHSFSFI